MLRTYKERRSAGAAPLRGVGHVGERDGAAEGDTALASKFHELGDEGADFMDFEDVAEFGGEFSERVGGRSGEGVAADVSGAENLAGLGCGLTALPTSLMPRQGVIGRAAWDD